jgi:hypothetical protein
MVKWLEAQERTQDRYEVNCSIILIFFESLHVLDFLQTGRREPLGQSSEPDDEFTRLEDDDPASSLE